MNLNKPAGAFFIFYLLPVLTLLYIIGANNSLDANFSVDELARQLLLPVSQLLKYKIGNKSSELGDIKKKGQSIRMIVVNTVLGICRSGHLGTPLQPPLL